LTFYASRTVFYFLTDDDNSYEGFLAGSGFSVCFFSGILAFFYSTFVVVGADDISSLEDFEGRLFKDAGAKAYIFFLSS
jgi:hypothetical protein